MKRLNAEQLWWVCGLILAIAIVVLLVTGCDPPKLTSWTPPPPPPPDRTATLEWEAPTKSANGTSLTDLAGFRVYRVQANSDLSAETQDAASKVLAGERRDVGQVLTSFYDGLAPGRHIFVVTAYDKSGNESAPSAVVSKEIR